MAKEGGCRRLGTAYLKAEALCPSPRDRLGKAPIKSKSIKQTALWLRPYDSALDLLGWKEVNAFVVRAEEGSGLSRQNFQRLWEMEPVMGSDRGWRGNL